MNQPAIAYDTRGTLGPRVLLVMGFGMRGELWKPQLDGLESDHHLAYFDNRGVGESDSVSGLWTMKTFAGDALRVADALGWTSFHLVGVSMGGMIAQELTLRAQSRVQSLSLIATHPGGHPIRYAPIRRGLRFLADAQRRGTGRLDAVRGLLYPQSFLARCDRESLDARMAAQLGRPASRATALRQLAAVARHRAGHRLSRLKTTPTLIVQPALDVLVPPRGSDDLKACMPHARLLTLEDAGHGAIFQRADTVNAALRRHMHESEMMALAANSPGIDA